MRPRLPASLILLAVLLASCAPGTSTVAPAQPGLVEQPAATLPPPVSTDSAVPSTLEPTDAVDPTAFPVATSRGPDLHATDPATVSLASGELQLVEFFRFT